jgi:DHA3 family macrolide efflux protein-like MFS transporter
MSSAATNSSAWIHAGRLQRLGAFTALCLGQMVSLFGSHLTSFVLGVWIYERTKSATNFALISFFAIMPEILLAPLAGAMVDRWNRRWLMIAGNAGAALATLTLVLLAMAGRLSIGPAYAIVALSSAFQAVQYPALSASTPLLVPARHLSRANGVVEFGNAAALIIAPFTAALFLAASGLKGVFTINVITFAFAAALLLASEIPAPQAPAGAKPAAGLLRQAVEGWTYIKDRPEFLGLLVLSAAINFVFGSVQVLLPPLVLSFASSLSLGTVMSSAGAGLMSGSLLISFLGTPGRKVKAVLLFALVQGVVLFLGVSQLSVALVGSAAFVFSVCTISIFVIVQTIWQTQIPRELQGRAFAMRRLIGWSSLPVAYLAAGPLADKIFTPLLMPQGTLAPWLGPWIGTGPGRGIALLFVVMGAVMIIAISVASRYRPFWELEARMLGAAPEPPQGQRAAAGNQEQIVI